MQVPTSMRRNCHIQEHRPLDVMMEHCAQLKLNGNKRRHELSKQQQHITAADQ
jgi:hypothetical protein